MSNELDQIKRDILNLHARATDCLKTTTGCLPGVMPLAEMLLNNNASRRIEAATFSAVNALGSVATVEEAQTILHGLETLRDAIIKENAESIRAMKKSGVPDYEAIFAWVRREQERRSNKQTPSPAQAP